MKDKEIITSIFGENSLLDYPMSSRVQTISWDGLWVDIKRDDELSCGIAGSKYRKYLSLVPYIKNYKHDHVLAEGSEFSNNILGLSQIFNEHKIDATFFLKKGYSESAVNKKLIDILTKPEAIEILPRKTWPDRQSLIDEKFAISKSKGHNPIFLPEGAFHVASLPGAMTLALDIDLSKYTSIYIDAGTGMSFLGLYFGLKILGYTGKIYVISLVEPSGYYDAQINHFQSLIPKLSQNQAIPFEVIHLKKSKSFGSQNKQTMKDIRKLACDHGILTDPIYSGKSIPRAMEHCKGVANNGSSSLIIHSGGTLSLPGFLI